MLHFLDNPRPDMSGSGEIGRWGVGLPTFLVPHVLLLLCLLLTIHRDPLLAQTAGSASMQGTITAPNRTPIPGAHVELSYLPTGTVHRLAADSAGRFSFPSIRIGGPYRLTVTHIGYAPSVREDLHLREHDDLHLAVVLRPVEVKGEEVVITGYATGSTASSLHVESSQLKAIPRASGTLQDIERLSPYMVDGNAIGFSRVFNEVSLDGLSVTDRFGLQHAETLPGGMQFSPVAMESIDEVRVDISPFDVQRSGFTGAAISAVSRGGTDTHTGSAYGNTERGWALGNNPDDRRHDLAGFHEDHAGVSFGGPMPLSRMYYFVAAEFAGVRLPLERKFGAPSTIGTTYSISPDAIARIGDLVSSQYGLSTGRFDEVGLERRTANVFARIDMELGGGDRLGLRYNFLSDRSDRPPYETTIYGSSAVDRATTSAHALAASYNGTLGKAVAAEVIAGFTRRRYEVDPQGTAFPYIDIVEADGQQWRNHLTAGSEIGAGGNDATEDDLEMKSSLSFRVREHLLTAGLQGEAHWFTTHLLSALSGRYTFASEAALARGVASTFEERYARDGGSIPGGRWKSFTWGAFLQDELELSPLFTLSLGLRADLPVFPDLPKENTIAHEAFVPAGFDVQTSRVPDSRLLVSPRAGFTWFPKEDRSIRLRGGAGIFTGHIPYAWIDNLYTHTGLDYVHIKTSENVPTFDPDPAHQPRAGVANGLRETMEIVAVAPGFMLPQEVRWSFAADLAFPGNILVSLESVISRTINGITFRNVNLKTVGTFSYAGPDIVTSETGDSRAIYARQDERFTNAILMGNVNTGTASYYTIQVQKRPTGNGLFASVAYTGGSTKDMNSGAWDNAYDQWRYNPSVEPNEPRLDFANFDRSQRIVAMLSYEHEWEPGWGSTLGLVYTGVSGSPFSYVYDGDQNGDGETLNDLFYIPGTYWEIVLFDNNGRLLYNDPTYRNFLEFLAKDDYLSHHRGQMAERNGARTPWMHLVDLRLAQKIPLCGSHGLEVSAEVLNVLNLLNPAWGIVYATPNHVVTVLKSIIPGGIAFRWEPRLTALAPEPLLSRWRLRVGLRYTF